MTCFEEAVLKKRQTKSTGLTTSTVCGLPKTDRSFKKEHAAKFENLQYEIKVIVKAAFSALR